MTADQSTTDFKRKHQQERDEYGIILTVAANQPPEEEQQDIPDFSTLSPEQLQNLSQLTKEGIEKEFKDILEAADYAESLFPGMAVPANFVAAFATIAEIEYKKVVSIRDYKKNSSVRVKGGGCNR